MYFHSHITLDIGKHWIHAVWRLGNIEWLPAREQEGINLQIRFAGESKLVPRVRLQPSRYGVSIEPLNGFGSHITVRHGGHNVPEPALFVFHRGYFILDGNDQSMIFDDNNLIAKILHGKFNPKRIAWAANQNADAATALHAWNYNLGEAGLTPLQSALMGRINQMRLRL